jgi:hypothetical protein
MKTERTIRNCSIRMRVVCPRTWDGLEATARAGVRHRVQCGEDVFLCETDAETIAHARAGHCIARKGPARSELGPMVLGRPEVPAEPTHEQREARQWATRERGIDTLLGGRIMGTTRVCPECAYPVPDFRKSCYVCGHELGRGP